jgi:hypothetical protein
MTLTLILAALTVSAQDTPRFEVGASLSTLTDGGATNAGPGFTGVWNIGRFVSLEGALNWFPREEAFSALRGPTFFNSVKTTSSALQVLTGVKAGYRNDRFGIFGKVRPGFISANNALVETIVTNIGTSPIETQRFGWMTEKALDVGGVFEYYPARRWAVRFDAGDTLIWHETGRVTFAGSPGLIPVDTPVTNPLRSHFQMNTGVHFRF